MIRNVMIMLIILISTQGVFLVDANSALTNTETKHTLNLSSFHSTPSAQFDQLRLIPRTQSANCQIGELFVDSVTGLLRFCGNNGANVGIWGPIPGTWTQNGNILFPTKTSSSTPMKLGIGTSAPKAILHIHDDNFTVDWPSGALYGDTAFDGQLLMSHSDNLLNLIAPRHSAAESQFHFTEVDGSGQFTNMWLFGRLTTDDDAFFLKYNDKFSDPEWWWRPEQHRMTIKSTRQIGFGSFDAPNPPLSELHIANDDGVTSLKLREYDSVGSDHTNWTLSAHDNYNSDKNSFTLIGGKEGSENTAVVMNYWDPPGQNLALFGFGGIVKPNYELHVGGWGTIDMQGTDPLMELIDTTGGTFALTASNNAFRIFADDDDPLSGTEVFNLQKDTLGIGSVGTTAVLHVDTQELTGVDYLTRLPNRIESIIIEAEVGVLQLNVRDNNRNSSHIMMSATINGTAQNNHWFINHYGNGSGGAADDRFSFSYGTSTGHGFNPENMSNDYLTIDTNGNVGIREEDPDRLFIVGSANGAYSDGLTWQSISSRKYKRDITPLDSKRAHAALDNLEPVTFLYKQNPEQPNIGFIAEDVPDLIATQDRSSLSPLEITALLTKVVQDQNDEIERRKELIEKQQKQIDTLKKKIQNL